MKEEYQSRKITAVSLAHFIHDIYPAFFAPMIPLLMARFGLSLSAAGLLDVARRIPSFATPVIGLIADRKPIKYFIILTPGVTAVSMSLIGCSTSYWIVFALLFTAGLSTVCFHIPSPVLIKNFAGAGRVKKGMGRYMASGAAAGTVGTFIATLIITSFGLNATWPMMFFGIATSVVLFFVFRNLPSIQVQHNTESGTTDSFRSVREFIPFFMLLAVVMVFRAGMRQALTLYLPVFLTHEGESLRFAGISLGILHLSGAAGMYVSSHFFDRFSTRKLLLALISCSVITMWGMIIFSHNRILLTACIVLLGILLFSTAPLFLALIQHLNTKRPAFLNSIYFTMGLMINSVMILLLGVAGDHFGLEVTYRVCAALPLLSLPFLLFFPDK